MAYEKFEDARELGKVFGNPRFKKNYADYIVNLQRKLYQPIGKWGRLLGAEGIYGIINTDIPLDKAPMSKEIREFYMSVYDNMDPKWSLLNYVNTNWTSFMHIVNVVNYWIDTKQIKNEDYFTFNNNYFDELERLKSILNKTGQHILMPDSNLASFWKIMGGIATTTYLGNRGECATLESLTELGEISDVVKSKPGQRIDTHGGVDIRFKLNGVRKTIQCKSFMTVNLQDGQFIFSDVVGGKEYDVDFFSFVNKRSIYVFDTKKEGLRYRFNLATGSYIFDQRLLKYKMYL